MHDVVTLCLKTHEKSEPLTLPLPQRVWWYFFLGRLSDHEVVQKYGPLEQEGECCRDAYENNCKSIGSTKAEDQRLSVALSTRAACR